MDFAGEQPGKKSIWSRFYIILYDHIPHLLCAHNTHIKASYPLFWWNRENHHKKTYLKLSKQITWSFEVIFSSQNLVEVQTI
jgi:hypothetical protein